MDSISEFRSPAFLFMVIGFSKMVVGVKNDDEMNDHDHRMTSKKQKQQRECARQPAAEST
jgi:hypothetical protein